MIQVYKSEGVVHPVLQRLPTGPMRGAIVYTIYVYGRPVYVGFSEAQPRRTILRHFQARTKVYQYSGRGPGPAIWTVHDLPRPGTWRSWSVHWSSYSSASAARAAEAARLKRGLPAGNRQMRGEAPRAKRERFDLF